MEKRRRYLLFLVLSCCIGLIFIMILYLINLDIVLETMANIEGAFTVLIIYILRISIILGMAIFLFKRWFAQEVIYTSDLPFLFGMFFIMVFFGKFLGMLSNFMFPVVDLDYFLFYLKIRQFVLIGSLAPMVFLSIMMIIFFLQANGRIHRYNDPKERNAFSFKILAFYVVLEAILIIITPNTIMAGINAAFLVILPLLVTTWMFYFSYYNKRLSQIHPLIVAIGFTGYLVSSVLRVVLQTILGEDAFFIFITEVIDIIIFLIIFTGYIKKAQY